MNHTIRICNSHWYTSVHTSVPLEGQCFPAHETTSETLRILLLPVSHLTSHNHTRTHCYHNLSHEMCTYNIYISKTCSHRWVAIVTPCGPGKGIGNCDTVKKMNKPLHLYRTTKEHCPRHQYGYIYDYGKFRMITKVEWGCCVM